MSGLFFNELIEIAYFRFSLAFLCSLLSLYIAQERTLFASRKSSPFRFFVPGLRLVIAQQRQDRIQLDLQTRNLASRERRTAASARNEEHLEEMVAERTVKLEESRQAASPGAKKWKPSAVSPAVSRTRLQ